MFTPGNLYLYIMPITAELLPNVQRIPDVPQGKIALYLSLWNIRSTML